MKYLKYFENVNLIQQPLYLSPGGDHLYLSEELAKRIKPTIKEVKNDYKSYTVEKIIQEQNDFYNDVRTERGNLKVSRLNLHKSSSYDNGSYKMDLFLHRRSPALTNEFGTFKTYLDGSSGDHYMHGKNMKRATRECNLKFIIYLYPIVGHIKNFYKIFKNKKPFLDIIKDELDKDIMLAQYGIPDEIKHLFDYDIESSVKNSIKYNI